MIDEYAAFFSSCFKSELSLIMTGIVPSKGHELVFERVVYKAKQILIAEGELIVSKVKKSVQRHDFSAALNLLPLLRHLLVADFEKLSQYEMKGVYTCLLNSVQVTISKTLEEFIKSIKDNRDAKMPKDGTVLQSTCNTIMLLKQLQDYQDVLDHKERVLGHQGYQIHLEFLSSVLTLHNTFHASTKYEGEPSFAQYMTTVLSTLEVALQTKSDYYSDVYLRAIFRMNNLHYILKALQRTGLLEVVLRHNPSAENYYNDQIRDQKRIYSQSWNRVLHFIEEADDTVSQTMALGNSSQMAASIKLRDKDKQNIKDKFSGFNKEMKKITHTQKAYAVLNIELRESLKRENKEFILPKYTMLYERFIHADFTENIDKYIKYTSQDLSNTMDTFFEASGFLLLNQQILYKYIYD